MAVAAWCDRCRDGGHGRLLQARLLRPGSRLRRVAGQRPARQECPRPQDRHWRDAAWLCRLLEHGLLRKSFVAPREIREIRDLTRYRKALIRERASEVNRLHKVLEDAGVKLASVASDIMGVSGRKMLAALVAGTTDPEVLAEMAQTRLRARLPELRKALNARFREH